MGRSNYNFTKLLKQTITTFVTFSDLPLKLASWIGLFSFFMGMIWLSVIVIGKITGWITVSGFASLMGGIVLFGGVQLLILGIMGEYLGRMNFRLSRKPLFLISAETAHDKDFANPGKSSHRQAITDLNPRAGPSILGKHRDQYHPVFQIQKWMVIRFPRRR